MNIIIRHKLPIYSLLFLLLFLSCRQEKEERELLEQAGLLIEARPDSALLLLNRIPSPQKLTERTHAEYALLLTKARDKNYITHTNDSLINIAVEYYSKERNSLNKAEAYFYLGSVYRDMEYSTSAIAAFLKALEVMPDNSEDRLMMLIYNNLAQQYEAQNLYENAMEMAKKSYKFCSNNKQTNSLFHASRRIGGIFLLESKNDSALFYYNQALEIAETKKDSLWEATVLCDIARIYKDKGELITANNYTDKAIKRKPGKRSLDSAFFLKGTLLLEQGKSDSARYYLLRSINSGDINARAASFHRLYDIERLERNYEKAIEYNNIYIVIRDSIAQKKRRLEINTLINEHTLGLQMKDHFIKQQKQEFAITILSIIIIAMIILIILIAKRRKTERVLSLQKELMRNKVSGLKLVQDTGESASITTGIDEDELFYRKLQLCINLLKTDNRYDIINKMQQTNNRKKLSMEERKTLKAAVFENFVDIIEDIKNKYNKLSELDIYCCILYLLGCENTEAAICMGVHPDTLKVRRSRIRNKIEEKFYNLIFKDKSFDY